LLEGDFFYASGERPDQKNEAEAVKNFTPF